MVKYERLMVNICKKRKTPQQLRHNPKFYLCGNMPAILPFFENMPANT